MISFYNILIGIGTALISFIAFGDEIAKKVKWLGIFKSLIYKVPVFIASTILIIWATNEKDNENENNSNKDKQILVNALRTRDSINQLKFDSVSRNSLKIIDTSNKNTIAILSKYNLKIDSNRNEIVKALSDSSNKVLDLPFLNLCIDSKNSCVKLSDRQFEIPINICNQSIYPAQKVQIFIYWCNIISGRINLIKKDTLYNDQNKKLAPQGVARYSMTINFPINFPENIYCLFDINFENSRGEKKNNSPFVSFNLKNKTTDPWDLSIETQIRKLFEYKIK